MSQLPPIFDAIGQSMKHLGQRQRVIAQNVANADTPGYKAQDIEKPDFGAMVDSGAGGIHVARPRVTPSAGMRAMGVSAPLPGMIDDADISETKPDGNNVTLEDQLLKMGQVQTEFATMTNMYRKQMGLLKAALGKGGTG